MCCGKGPACDRSGLALTGEQVRQAQMALLAAFDPRARYAASTMARMVREHRQAAARWDRAFSCGTDVLGRGGSAEEFLACDTGGADTGRR